MSFLNHKVDHTIAFSTIYSEVVAVFVVEWRATEQVERATYPVTCGLCIVMWLQSLVWSSCIPGGQYEKTIYT